MTQHTHKSPYGHCKTYKTKPQAGALLQQAKDVIRFKLGRNGVWYNTLGEPVDIYGSSIRGW